MASRVESKCVRSTEFSKPHRRQTVFSKLRRADTIPPLTAQAISQPNRGQPNVMLQLATKFTPETAAFTTAFQAGFRAVEFWTDPQWLGNHEQIASLAAKYPFRYAFHFPNGGTVTADQIHGAVTLYRRLNCTAIVIHQPMYQRHAAALREREPQIVLAVENHVLDLNQFDRWAEEHPSLTLDVEHLWKFTLRDAPLGTLLEHLERFLGRHSEKLQHVHLLGYQPGDEEHQPIHYNAELAIEVLTRLSAHGFKKLVVSEADTPFQTLENLSSDVRLFELWRAEQTPARQSTELERAQMH